MPIFNSVYKSFYEWKPDASRTLLYLPLESNATDYSGNNRETSPSWITYTTVWWVPSAHVGSTWWITVISTWFIDHSTPYMTMSALCYVTSSSQSNNRYVVWWAMQNKASVEICIVRSWHWTYPNKYLANNLCNWWDIIANQWIHIVVTGTSTQYKIYINWVLKDTQTNSSGYSRWNWSYSYENSQTLLNARDGVSSNQALNWNTREIIFENVEWSADDVSKYYQFIKNKLWI